MYDEQTLAYFARRAEAERSLALKAPNAEVRKVHLIMADEYARGAQGLEPRMTRQSVVGYPKTDNAAL